MFILAPKFDSMNDKTFRNRISKPGDTGRMGKAYHRTAPMKQPFQRSIRQAGKPVGIWSQLIW